MDIKEKIHATTEELLSNMERLVAIDSQLGTPAEGMPFGEGPAKVLHEALQIADELGFKTVNLDNYWEKAKRSLVSQDIWISYRRAVTGHMIHSS